MDAKKKDRKIRPGRTKVKHDQIQRTPVPVVMAASKLVTSPHHTAALIPPSTPVIPMISASVLPAASFTSKPNIAPMVMFGVENLLVRVGAYMEYRIPDDAFYDAEEGGTRNLNLEVGLWSRGQQISKIKCHTAYKKFQVLQLFSLFL